MRPPVLLMMQGSIYNKRRDGTVTYVCVPCLKFSSKLVEIGTLARNQRNIITSLGKEASDGGQRKRK